MRLTILRFILVIAALGLIVISAIYYVNGIYGAAISLTISAIVFLALAFFSWSRRHA